MSYDDKLEDQIHRIQVLGFDSELTTLEILERLRDE